MDKGDEWLQRSCEFVAGVEKGEQLLRDIIRMREEFEERILLLNESLDKKISQGVAQTGDRGAQYVAAMEAQYEKIRQMAGFAAAAGESLPEDVRLFEGRRVIIGSGEEVHTLQEWLGHYDYKNNLLLLDEVTEKEGERTGVLVELVMEKEAVLYRYVSGGAGSISFSVAGEALPSPRLYRLHSSPEDVPQVIRAYERAKSENCHRLEKYGPGLRYPRSLPYLDHVSGEELLEEFAKQVFKKN